jgi:glyoxylase-like metal-dependent hydrolase (beta-lactamase superfamily II)
MESVRIGEVEVIALNDMTPPLRDPEDFFPDIPLADWGPHKEENLIEGKIQLYYACFALRTQGKIIMVDTGIGPGPHHHRGGHRGDLLHEMQLKGLDPEDVELVVHTHLHHDHIGWNVSGDGGSGFRATFPNARYLVPRNDWNYFTQPAILEENQAVKDCVLPLEGLGVMELVDSGVAINSQLSTTPTPGHTPGHVNVLIESEGQKGAIVGDMIHLKVEVDNPNWCPGADVDKPTSRESRKSMLTRFAAENYIVAACHFWPEDHFGRVVVEGDRFRWQSL